MSQDTKLKIVRYMQFVVVALLLLRESNGQQQVVGDSNSQCSVQTADGFSLSWISDAAGSVVFQYSQTNLPTTANAYWTGVAFGESYQNRVDGIIIEVLNGQTVSISSGSLINGRLEKSYPNIVSTQNANIYGGAIQATFSRPLFNDGRSLDTCNTWQFYTQPTMIYNMADSTNNYEYSQNPVLKTICSISTYCQMSTSQILYATTLNPSYDTATPISGYSTYTYVSTAPINYGYTSSTIQPSSSLYSTTAQTQYINNAYTSSNAYVAQTNPTYYTTAIPSQSYTAQASGYSYSNNLPTSTANSVNIYGYNYDSNSAASSGNLIQNANYDFLDDVTLQRYLQNNQYGNTFGTGNLMLSDSVNAPILTNEQQNQVNYQQILADYQLNPNPNAYLSSSSTNIYGYDYATSGNNYYSPSSSSSSLYTNAYNIGASGASSSGALSGYTTTVSPYSSFYSGSSTYSPTLYSSQNYQNPSASSTSSASQQYYQPSVINSLSLLTTTPDPYNIPRAESYLNRQFDTAVNGAPYYPYRTSLQVIEPNSGSYYQATLHNRK